MYILISYVFYSQVWRNIARGNKELALSNVFARFQRFWRREFAWRKQQEAAFTAAKKAADDESQAMALAELAAIEAHEKEAKLSAEKASQAKITLDGYKRDTRHSSTQRMASDLALNHLKQVRRERRSVKRRIATKDNTCAADSPAAPVASGLATEAIATAHDGSVVPLFLAVRKLRIEAEVTQARKEHGCDARNKRFAAWSLRQQTQGEKSPSPPRSSPPSPPPDQITEERFVEAEEERADDMKELLTLERELCHDIYDQVQSGCETLLDRKTLWQRLLVLLARNQDFRTYLDIPSRENDGVDSSPAQGALTDVEGFHWREVHEQSLPLGQPEPDAPPGPPELEGFERTGGEGRCRRERKPVDYVSERVSSEMEQAQSVKRTVHSRVSTHSDHESGDEDDDHDVDRASRKQDGKGRRTGAKLVLTSSCAAEASLLGTLEGHKNSLMAKLPYRNPQRIFGELPLGAVEVATMPLMEQYEPTADGRLQWDEAMTAWLRKNTRDTVVQKRWAAAREKKVGLIHNWLTIQGHSQWAEWTLDDPSNPNSGWVLRLLVSDGLPSLPTAQQICSWAFAYSKGIAKKGGNREYRAKPWYGKINGGSQATMLMPEGKERAYGYGAFADEPPRYTTIEQYLSALRQWLKEELRDYPLVANPANTKMVREVTRTLEGQQGRAVVEERLPRALSEQEIAGAIRVRVVRAELR